MSLATAGDNGPDAAAVFYVNLGLDFFFISAPRSQHCCNLQANPQVAVTIHEDYSQWSAIQGVQMGGIVRQLEGAEIDPARASFAAKFPDVPLLPGASDDVGRAVQKACWYGISVTRLRFIDNSRAFGHRSEWTREAFIADSDAPP